MTKPRTVRVKRLTPKLRRARCDWVEDIDSNWETECGELYTIIEGDPEENRMAYCCYCGGLLKWADAARRLVRK